MTTRLLCTVLLALASPCAIAAQPPKSTESAPPAQDTRPLQRPTLGTLVSWEASPTEAFTRAGKDGRLVLLLHLSGKFHSPALT